MDFKKFAADAGTFFNRAKQYTEEKLGQAERTELDAQFENLQHRADNTKLWTERILAQTEALLEPNPTTRVEAYFYEKLDKKKRERETNAENLGQVMIDASNDFGPGTTYGAALIKCGQAEQKVGVAEKEFLQTAANNFLQPLKAFLEGDMKTVQKERKVLEQKRLDLDACKTRLRRAKSIGAKDQPNPMPPQIAYEAEAELRVAQSEFDRQAEITKLLLEGISSTHAHHLRCLHDFIEAQSNYYARCQQHMAELQKQLGSFSATSMNHSSTISPGIYPPPLGGSGGGAGSIVPGSGGATGNHSNATAPTINDLNIPAKKAKVLYDYDAADQSELSLVADEVITVYNIPGQDDWVMGERGTQKGKVPLTYLQTLQ